MFSAKRHTGVTANLAGGGLGADDGSVGEDGRVLCILYLCVSFGDGAAAAVTAAAVRAYAPVEIV